MALHIIYKFDGKFRIIESEKAEHLLQTPKIQWNFLKHLDVNEHFKWFASLEP